jgi:Asp-tRNA(Asn)/Glu-tRNA(Gln) amidotransferase A subunit family amidase
MAAPPGDPTGSTGQPSPETAATIAADVRAGRRRAVDEVDRCLDEIGEDPLNAFTLVSDAAGADAAAVDAAVAAGQDPGPLAGVPVAVKDLIDQAGVPNTAGSGFPPTTPDVDATVIARLRAAGAVIVGRTGLHEFAFGFSSENEWFGPVRNPWDPATSPGGSSGGSAAAVGAGLVPVALGTDTGGSVRVPAALCGVVGLKVTHGAIPTTGVFPLAASLDTVGPITRTVTDAAVMFTALAGHDPADPWSRVGPPGTVGKPPSLGSITLGIAHPWVDRPLSDEVASGWASFRDAAGAAGISVVDLDLPELEYPGSILASVYPEVALVHADRYRAEPERYGREVGDRVASTLEYTLDDYLDGLAWRRRVGDALDRALLDGCDAVITPAVATLRKVIGVDTVTVGGTDEGYRSALSCFTAVVNHAGHPALVAPIAVPGTPPPSIQLIGRRGGDHTLLELGIALECAGLIATPPPPPIEL